MSTESVFTEIHNKNTWGDIESRSGPGSNFIQTEEIRRKLPELFKELKINSLLDHTIYIINQKTP